MNLSFWKTYVAKKPILTDDDGWVDDATGLSYDSFNEPIPTPQLDGYYSYYKKAVNAHHKADMTDTAKMLACFGLSDTSVTADDIKQIAERFHLVCPQSQDNEQNLYTLWQSYVKEHIIAPAVDDMGLRTDSNTTYVGTDDMPAIFKPYVPAITKGSKKQIAWATSIRNKFLRNLLIASNHVVPSDVSVDYYTTTLLNGLKKYKGHEWQGVDWTDSSLWIRARRCEFTAMIVILYGGGFKPDPFSGLFVPAFPLKNKRVDGSR